MNKYLGLINQSNRKDKTEWFHFTYPTPKPVLCNFAYDKSYYFYLIKIFFIVKPISGVEFGESILLFKKIVLYKNNIILKRPKILSISINEVIL